jgi:hypothetical protein
LDETTIDTQDFIDAMASRIGELEKENIALTIAVRKQEAIISSLNSALLSAVKSKEEASVVDVV